MHRTATVVSHISTISEADSDLRTSSGGQTDNGQSRVVSRASTALGGRQNYVVFNSSRRPTEMLDEEEDSEPEIDVHNENGEDHEVHSFLTAVARKTKEKVMASWDELYDLRAIHEQNMRLDPEQRKKKRENRSERQVEALPIKSLLATYEPIIGQARDYQLELFEAAKRENIIAVLDTGSGKTLIACLLIRHILDKELEDRGAGKRSRVSVFLCDNVTLVYQQASVLECNIDAKVGVFCGTSKNLLSKSFWEKALKENMIFVMTADVLNNNLTRAFMTMKDINLLCFDEVHRAKKDHVYSRILKNFYIAPNLDLSDRPKIFGMTASPIDATHGDVVDVATRLETILHSKILTARDLKLLQYCSKKPKEQVLVYPRPRPTFCKTDIYREMEENFGNIEMLKKSFIRIKHEHENLGPWVADYLWKYLLRDKIVSKLIHLEEVQASQTADATALKQLDQDISLVRQAESFVAAQNIPDPDIDTDVTAKVQRLYWYLVGLFEDNPNVRCIVFVDRRTTAVGLSGLFNILKIPHMRVASITGRGRTDSASYDRTASLREQMLAVHKFRRGVYNCLFATSVAEEGLDIPDCNVIVRFDLYSTMIQYVQSRGRARHIDSTYVHMLEEHNFEQKQKLLDVKQSEIRMRQFCETLPEDRMLTGRFSEITSNYVPQGELFWEDPETGAKLTPSSALSIIQYYSDILSAESENQPVVYRVFKVDGKNYACDIHINTSKSGGARITLRGRPMPSKIWAKRFAAFELAIKLREDLELDGWLKPVYEPNKRHAMANAILSLNSKKGKGYKYKKKAEFWTPDPEAPDPEELWATVITIKDTGVLGFGYQPYVILTRKKMPCIPSFELFFDMGPSNIIFTRLAKPIRMADYAGMMDDLNEFTIRTFRHVFNKLFKFTTKVTPYWIGPILSAGSSDITEDSDFDQIFDWKQFNYAAKNELAPNDFHKFTTDEEANGKVMMERRNFSRRFLSLRLAPHLKPTDPCPEGAPGHGKVNIFEYTMSMDKPKKKESPYTADLRGKWDIVVEAERIAQWFPLTYNAPRDSKNLKKTAYVTTIPFHISPLNADYFQTCLTLPAIMHRLNSYLHAHHAFSLLGIDIRVDIGLEALTKDSDNTDEDGAEQINKKKGMGPNYERLEFLGDCFLKMSTTMALFVHYHSDDEQTMHIKRMLLLCNKNLYRHAARLGLMQYIQAHAFSRPQWYPEVEQVKGIGKEVNKGDIETFIKDKGVADVCEAMMGAALADQGLDAATLLTTNMLDDDDHRFYKWEDFYKAYKMPTYQTAPCTAATTKLCEMLEKEVGYKFKYPRLAQSAFLHSSIPSSWDKTPSYQRLEFLGDSVLDMVCIRYMYEKYPKFGPGWLTEHKMAMVSNKFLGAFCVDLGLNKHLRFTGAQLHNHIQRFVEDVQMTKDQATKDGVTPPNWWVHVKEATPKALSDVVESLVGAMFVDSEFDFNVVVKFFNKYMLPFFEDMHMYDSYANQHPTTFLSNKMRELRCERFTIKNAELPYDRTDPDAKPVILAAVIVHGKILAYGEGEQSKYARIAAAKQALEKLNNMAPDVFMRDWCFCDKIREEVERVREEKAKGTEVSMVKHLREVYGLM